MLNREKGFSLLEMLVVLTLIGIVATLAIANFGRANSQLQRQNTARQLKIYLDRARFDSVKRNAETFDDMSKLIIHSSTSFSSVLDLNHNGKIEGSETNLTTISAGSGVKILGNNLIFPITITFDHRGHARAINGLNADVTPTFVICGQNCTLANADQTNSNTLSISPTGTVALVEPSKTFFGLPIPKVTLVPIKEKINSKAQVSE